MNIETIKSHAEDVYCLFKQLEEARNTQKYYVGDHNVCCAVVCKCGCDDGEVFYSYSNISAIRSKKYNGLFIPNDSTEKIITASPMQECHTEFRLINYLYANGYLSESGTMVHLFSTRPVCDSCKNGIMKAMETLKGRVGVMAYDLDAQDGQPKLYIRPIMLTDDSSTTIDF